MRAVSQAQKLHLTQESFHKDVKRVGEREMRLHCSVAETNGLYKLAIFVIICPIFSAKNCLEIEALYF